MSLLVAIGVNRGISRSADGSGEKEDKVRLDDISAASDVVVVHRASFIGTCGRRCSSPARESGTARAIMPFGSLTKRFNRPMPQQTCEKLWTLP